jgi:hypothetical protein
MSPSPKNNFPPDECWNVAGAADETLQLVARLPAPDGLADRVNAGLRVAPEPGRVLNWRQSRQPGSGGWMYGTIARSAAAAAIVCVVVGGGWRIYSRVQPVPTAKVIVMPPREGPAGGGFSPAGAKRVPQTLQGPVLTHPVLVIQEPKAAEKATVPSPSGTGSTTGLRKKKAVHATVTPTR